MTGAILLIEPDKILARIYADALKRDNYKVVQAHDAQSAIRAMDKQSFVLIILELQLADHNGIEFLYELRSYSEWHDRSVVLHTNVPKTSLGLSKQQMKNFGIKAYVYKPATSLQQLIQVVELTLPIVVT